MDSTDSSTGSQQPNLPPGFRFHPTDEELVVHYLKKKKTSSPLPVAIIAEVDLYKFDPWELPAKATFGEQEWYFFSPRDRKYPNGARPNRAATSGYWKATGTDKPVLSSAGGNQKVGVKKALVFYGGKPPKGIKTNWIMHEYRLADNKPNNKPPCFDIGKKNSLRLDDWVLCRIYKKSNTSKVVDHERDDSMDSMLLQNMMLPPSISILGHHQQSSRLLHHHHLSKNLNYGPYLENNDQNNLYVEGFINSNDQGNNNNNPNSSLVIQNTTNPNACPMKRPLPSLFWSEENEVGESSKRVHEDDNDNQNGSNSIVTMLSQLPPQAPSFGDATFRQPYQLSGLNWYS